MHSLNDRTIIEGYSQSKQEITVKIFDKPIYFNNNNNNNNNNDNNIALSLSFQAYITFSWKQLSEKSITYDILSNLLIPVSKTHSMGKVFKDNAQMNVFRFESENIYYKLL